jgi:ribonucleoside-diphosphate reductase beta chain
MAANANPMQQSLLRMADEDPQLAARMLITALPAAAAGVRGPLDYELVVEELGAYRVSIGNGAATVTSAEAESTNGNPEFVLRTDARALARLAAGASPLRLMLGGRLHVQGKRRRALKLRRLTAGLTMREIARAGVEPDPDLVYQALPYAIDPAWTKGHRFCVKYELRADATGAGGVWYAKVDDGEVSVATEPPEGGADASVILSHEVWLRLVRGDVSPNESMRAQLVRVEGKMMPVTVMGRWIERAEGRDDPELEREQRQRLVQEARATWGSSANGATPVGQGDPAQAGEQPQEAGGNGRRRGARRRQGAALLSYEDLYALWERQNWKAHEIDFTVDKQHWLATPSEGQLDTMWSLSSFYIGEERVAADLAPFVLAAPSGEIEIFLTTQLVDEARHAAFFDRFMAEVMALEPEDIRGRLAQMEERMLPAWRLVFDDQLRGVARRLLERPDDLDLFVEGIVTYHVVIEGVLAMTGQHQILKYLEAHDIYPGFQQGFSLVEQDEHRHIAFGIRFLKDACEAEPRYRELILRKITELVPTACHVFVPPGTDDPSDFMSYDYHSSEIYGFAYRALKRRMAVVGVEVPPPEEIMPGPIVASAAPMA